MLNLEAKNQSIFQGKEKIEIGEFSGDPTISYIRTDYFKMY